MQAGSGGGEPRLAEALAGIFRCSPETALVICGRAVDRRYPVRAVILRQGDRVAETYLMVAGRAQSLVIAREGQQVQVSEFFAGDIFGAVGHADTDAQQADVVSVETVRAAQFRAVDFLGLIERHGCVGLAVSRMLTRQLQVTRLRMVEDITLTAGGRVCAELLRLARAGDGRRISPPPVITALAARVHTTRETASRTISDLVRRLIIRREKDALVVVSIRGLDELSI
jgi:CRP/FNR family cyclic AMP-dependent transcriptional regulator